MTFLQKLSAYSLGLITDKDLPDVAMTGLEEGYDSESLRILAGHNTTDNSFVLNDYFLRTLKELGLAPNDKKKALINVVVFYAKNIVDRNADTYLEFEKLNEIINRKGYEIIYKNAYGKRQHIVWILCYGIVGRNLMAMC